MNVLTVFVVSVAVAAGKNDAGWKLTPQLLPGQEVVYTGKIVQTNFGAEGVKYEQPFQLETTMLVLDNDTKKNAEVRLSNSPRTWSDVSRSKLFGSPT